MRIKIDTEDYIAKWTYDAMLYAVIYKKPKIKNRILKFLFERVRTSEVWRSDSWYNDELVERMSGEEQEKIFKDLIREYENKQKEFDKYIEKEDAKK